MMKVSGLLTLIVLEIVFGEHQNKERARELRSVNTNKFKNSRDRCPAQNITFQNAITYSWPESKPDAVVLSKPLCLSPKRVPVSRRCVVGEGGLAHWEPQESPFCHGESSVLKDSCPPPFTTVIGQDVCLLLTQPTSGLTSPCLSLGSHVSVLDLPDNTFRGVISKLIGLGVSSVWVPAKRNDPFGPILNSLPGPNWLDVIQKQLLRHKLSSTWSLRQSCLSLNLLDYDNILLRTENCSAVFLPAVCLLSRFSKQKVLMEQFCPEDYKASIFGDDELRKRCFKIVHSRSDISWMQAEETCSRTNNGRLANILSHYDTRVIKELIKTSDIEKDKICWFGLQSAAEELTWGVNTDNLDYVNWAPDLSVESSTGKGAIRMTDASWVLLPENTSLPCYICETTAAEHGVKTDLHIRFNAAAGKLYLSVYWPQGLWRISDDEDGFRCFTNAGIGLIKTVKIRKKWEKKWTVEDVKILKQLQEMKDDVRDYRNSSNIQLHVYKQIYKVSYDKKKSGQYWCEGHFVNGMFRKTSNTVLLRAQEGNTFSVLMDIHGACRRGVDTEISCDPTLTDVPQRMAEKLKNAISRSRISTISAMNVLNVFNNGTLRLLLHVRTSRNHISLEEDYQETYKVLLGVAKRNPGTYTLHTFRSTDGCLADVSGKFKWRTTELGSTAISQNLCIDTSTELLARRQCLGNFVYGAFWNSSSVLFCLEEDQLPSRTKILYSLATTTSDKLMRGVLNDLLNVLDTPNIFLSANDVYFVACTMTNLADLVSSKNVTLPSFDKVISVLNSMLAMDENTLEVSQSTLNSTNMLLDAVERFIDRMMVESVQGDGVLLAVSPQVIVQISDPTVSNVSGLALLRDEVSDITSFGNLSVISLNSEQEDFFTAKDMKNLEVAVWIPEEIMLEFRNNGSSTYLQDLDSAEDISSSKNYYTLFENMKQKARVAIVIFYNDHIFKGTSSMAEDKKCLQEICQQAVVGSRVVSVFIPGFSSDLPLPISIIFRPVNEDPSVDLENSQQCAFWDFAYNSSTPSASFGGWTSEGCMYAGNYSTVSTNLDICVCTHLSHFAELVRRHYPTPGFDYVGSAELEDADRWALEIITLIGCLLSLVGVCGIFFTAVLFRSWRQKAGTKVLLQLSVALGFQMIIFLLSDFDMTETVDLEDGLEFLSYPLSSEGHYSTRCLAIGATLQYSVMSSFAWMLVTALLQFLRYVRVLGPTRPPRFFLKSMAFAWGVPVIPVVLVLTIDPTSYQPTDPKSLLCYPTGYSLYLATLLPITLIVGANFVVYVMIICSFVRMSERKDRHSSSVLYQQVRLSFMLFFLLGLSWVFGIMAALNFGLAFTYLFCITATLQGFVLFVFFVLCDPTTRSLWSSGAASIWKKLGSDGTSSNYLSNTVCTTPSESQKNLSKQSNSFSSNHSS